MFCHEDLNLGKSQEKGNDKDEQHNNITTSIVVDKKKQKIAMRIEMFIPMIIMKIMIMMMHKQVVHVQMGNLMIENLIIKLNSNQNSNNKSNSNTLMCVESQSQIDKLMKYLLKTLTVEAGRSWSKEEQTRYHAFVGSFTHIGDCLTRPETQIQQTQQANIENRNSNGNDSSNNNDSNNIEIEKKSMISMIKDLILSLFTRHFSLGMIMKCLYDECRQNLLENKRVYSTRIEKSGEDWICRDYWIFGNDSSKVWISERLTFKSYRTKINKQRNII